MGRSGNEACCNNHYSDTNTAPGVAAITPNVVHRRWFLGPSDVAFLAA